MLTYIKRSSNTRNRLINVLVCTMQLIPPVLGMVALMIVEGQEKELSQIVKAFVTIGFCLGIDNMFAGNLPNSVKKNLI